MYWFLFGLYNLLFIPLLNIAVHLAAPFSAKIAQGLQDRKDLFPQLQQNLSGLDNNKPRIWIHISSMGEFEQAKPVIALLKERHPDWIVLLSFFSPSGYRPARNYPLADLITYLPLDSYRHARRFVEQINPSIGLVIRHDIWLNSQHILHQRGIPALLIDASIADIRLSSYHRWRIFFRPFYRHFNRILTVSPENSRRFAEFLGSDKKVASCGDTRYDQVVLRSQETERIQSLTQLNWFEPRHCLIAGSTWPSDEQHILPVIEHWLARDPNNRCIIAPHETTVEHIADLRQWAAKTDLNAVLFSAVVPESMEPPPRVLIIDKVGLLANLYALASLAFVGGSFGPGIHSVLEPAAHGCVLFWGPRYRNSVEAQMFVQQELGVSVANSRDAIDWLDGNVDDWQQRQALGKRIRQTITENTGASNCIIKEIEKFIN